MNSEEIETLSTGVIDMLSCDICSEFIGEKIYQCCKGHVFCNRCAMQMAVCPCCRADLPRTGIRNRALEGIFGLLPSIPCIQQGCEVHLPFQEMSSHYNKCDHRATKCPLYTCSWSGKIIDIEAHMEEAHEDEAIDIDTSLDILLTNSRSLTIEAYSQTLLRARSGKYFIVGFWIIKGHEIASAIIGTFTYLGASSEKLMGSMSVIGSHNGYVLTCRKRPWTTLEDVLDAVKSRHNLVLDWGLALEIGHLPPVYREHDQMRRYPQASGLNLSISINIQDTDDNEPPGAETDEITVDFLERPRVDNDF